MEHYRSINSYLRERFGCKVYKLALDGGFTCPNRDGTLGSRGCIFCSGRGSGDFSIPVSSDAAAAVEKARDLVRAKNRAGKYIAYFQSYTGTYAPLPRLRELYTAAMALPDIVALAIGTRPDCLGDGVLELLAELNRIKPIWVELGLQTIHQASADYIRRGYNQPVYDEAVSRLRVAGLETVAHMIIGLPGETPEMMFETAEYIGRSGVQGIKFQLLHVLSGTDLAADYAAGKFKALEMDEYIDILAGCIRRIPPHMVVHRLTGDGDKRELIAPLWSGDKKRVLNAINEAFDAQALRQGELL